MNRRGQTVIPPKYDVASDFADGLAAVQVGNEWGYISMSEKMVIPLRKLRNPG
ncbi:MAG: WG repeat-containing protein [Acidobacteriaceae bacterium]